MRAAVLAGADVQAALTQQLDERRRGTACRERASSIVEAGFQQTGGVSARLGRVGQRRPASCNGNG